MIPRAASHPPFYGWSSRSPLRTLDRLQQHHHGSTLHHGAILYLCRVSLSSKLQIPSLRMYSRDSKIKGDGCNIGVTHSVGVAYALAYFLFINAYYCLHFIYLFPAVRCILIPHWPPGTEAYYCLEVLKTPPFPVPVATPWGRYYERRAAVTLAIFNAITAIAPVTTCVLMLSLDEGLGGQWWTFAVVICGDLVISAFGIGIWEARLWKVMKEYTPEEQKRKLKQARETSLCPSCGQGRGLVADGCSSRKSWWS